MLCWGSKFTFNKFYAHYSVRCKKSSFKMGLKPRTLLNEPRHEPPSCTSSPSPRMTRWLWQKNFQTVSRFIKSSFSNLSKLLLRKKVILCEKKYISWFHSMKGDDFLHGPQKSAQFLEVVGSNPSCFLCFYPLSLFILLYLSEVCP